MEKTGLPFEFEAKYGCGRLTLAPEVNSSPWDIVEKSGTEVIQQVESHKVSSLIVDLSPLNYLGSAQVALLVRVWKAISAKNGKMVVEVTSPVVREVLRTAGLNRLWQFVDSRNAAYELLGVNPEGERTVPAVWPLIACQGAIAALVLSALRQFHPELIDSKISEWGVIVAGVIAVVAGGYTAWRAQGLRRWLGVAALLAGLGAPLYEFYRNLPE